jgi:hypothetical protein
MAWLSLSLHRKKLVKSPFIVTFYSKFTRSLTISECLLGREGRWGGEEEEGKEGEERLLKDETAMNEEVGEGGGGQSQTGGGTGTWLWFLECFRGVCCRCLSEPY